VAPSAGDILRAKYSRLGVNIKVYSVVRSEFELLNQDELIEDADDDGKLADKPRPR
jgi:hypothetical protein